MRLYFIHIILLLSSFQSDLFGQKKIDEKQLDKLFWEEKYDEVIQDYYVLYLQNQNSPEICFKYGTSLLFEADSIHKLREATIILRFCIYNGKNEVKPEYHYFLGRALHTRGVYDSAIVQFELYNSKKNKKTIQLPSEKYLAYCKNGKSMQKLSSGSFERKASIPSTDIGEAYILKDIKLDGRFDPFKTHLTNIDIKKGVKPVWLFSDFNMKFFSSYGEKDAGHKDLYMVEGSRDQRKITKLPEFINTPEDEDYPYFDFETNYLYFSSKGHNSIGGYDIYRVDYDTATKTFGKIENLGIGISTPLDDFLFVYNSKVNKALLTSGYLGKTNRYAIFIGNITVYDKLKIKKQEVIATFKNEINPIIKLTEIKVIDKNSQEVIGKFKLDETGSTKMTLAPGEYNYFLSIYGSQDDFKANVIIPSSETQIEHEITYKLDDKNNEKVVINDSKSYNNEIIAENIDKDLDNQELITNSIEKNPEVANQIDPKVEKEALKKLNMIEFNPNEVVDKVSENIILMELAQKENEELMSNLNNVIVDNRNYYEEIQLEIDSIEKNLNEYSEIEKIEKLSYLKNLLSEQKEVVSQTIWMQELNDSLHLLNLESNPEKRKFKEIQDLGNVIQELTTQNKYQDAYEKIINKHEQIQTTKISSAYEKIYSDLQENELEQAQIEKNIISLSSEYVRLTEEFKNVELEIINASKKEKIQLEAKRDETQQKINSNQKRTKAYQRDLQELKTQAIDLELKRNLISAVKKDSFEESINYDEAKKKYFTESAENQAKISSIQEKIEQSNNKLTSSEKEYLVVVETYQSKKNNFDENTSTLQIIELEEELTRNINKLISEQSANPENSVTNSAIYENYLQEKLQESQSRINALKENESNIAKNNSNEENEENSEVTQSNTSAKNQTTNPQNNPQNQNTNASNSNEENEGNSEETQSNAVAKNQTANSQNNTQNQNSSSSNSNEENEENSEETQSNTVTKNQTTNSQNNSQNQNSNSANTIEENEENSEVTQSNTIAKNQTANTQNNSQNQNANSSNSNEENEENSEETQSNTVAKNQTTNPQNNPQNQNPNSANSNEENEENSKVTQSNTIDKKQDEYIPRIKNEDLVNNSIEFSNAKASAKEELKKSFPTVNLESTQQLMFEKSKVENLITTSEKEIEFLNDEKKKEKKKKKIELIKNSIKDKEQELLDLTNQRENIEEQIKKQKKDDLVLDIIKNSTSVDEQKSQEILASTAYKEYVMAIVSFENEKENFNSISISLEKQQKRLNELVNIQVFSKDKRIGSVEIESLVKEIENSQKQLETSYNKLKELKKVVEKVENENQEISTKMRILASNRKEPLTKIEVIKDEIISSGGFQITSTNKETNTDNKPIPMNVKTPSGLVYRVQIGAFRKPIPTNVYSQFTPVSGELQSNGLTVYMAGYFNNSSNAINARKQIQTLGYSDAFIVAYCNGKKLTLGEARQLEARGECIPQGDNDFLVEISKNTKEAQTGQIASLNNESSTAIDTKSLFFTVQIGVYNKPINEKEKFPGLNEITSNVSPKKQLRYSTGKFSDINSAKTRKNEAVATGISDAFIVAYYQGERITIAQANEIISKNESIVYAQNQQTNTANKIDSVKFISDGNKYFETEKKEVKIEKIKYEINTKFEELPNEKLAYFNQYSFFQFDKESGKLISTEFSRNVDLADELKLSGLVAEVKVNQTDDKKSDVKIKELTGDLMDMLLRTNWVSSIESSQEISLILNSNFSTSENYTNLLKNTFDLKIENYDKK